MDLDSADGAHRMTPHDTLFGFVGHPGGAHDPRIGAIQSYDVRRLRNYSGRKFAKEKSG